MAGIKRTNEFRVADRITKVDSNKGTSLVANISSQVGNIETTLEVLTNKLQQVKQDINELEEVKRSSNTLSIPETRKVIFLKRTVNSFKARVSLVLKRLTRFKKIPEKLANSALNLLVGTTLIKGLPIPGINLTAGATSTFAGTLEDLRIQGRSILNTSQAIDSLVDVDSAESLLSEIIELEQRLETLE